MAWKNVPHEPETGYPRLVANQGPHGNVLVEHGLTFKTIVSKESAVRLAAELLDAAGIRWNHERPSEFIARIVSESEAPGEGS